MTENLRLHQSNPLIGRHIERKVACPACGVLTFKIEPGKGPHAAHLRCSGCGRGGFWIGAKEARVN